MAIKRWDVLNRLVKQHSIHTVVEIGVRKGRNMRFVMQRNEGLIWYAVDPWEFMPSYPYWPQEMHDKCYKEFQQEKKRFGANRVKEIKLYSHEAVDKVPEGIDLVFIDGDHTYEAVKQDIALWTPKVRVGGIMSGHDYNNLPRFPGVKPAVDEVFDRVDLEPDWVWWTVV